MTPLDRDRLLRAAVIVLVVLSVIKWLASWAYN